MADVDIPQEEADELIDMEKQYTGCRRLSGARRESSDEVPVAG
jgi:hypothetical protein